MAEQVLPKGWAVSTVGDLAEYVNGRAFKPTEWKDAGKPIIRIQNLNNDGAKYNFSPEEHEEKYRVKNGDLLFAWSASLGAHIWHGGDAWLNQHIFNVLPKECSTKQFVYYLLSKITAELYAKAHGSGMVHVTKGKFESTEILLPPLNEQHRIVTKIEELFSELDKGAESLKTAQAQLKVYRQALLKHAFEGKLTAQWRADNPDKLETAAALQQRIARERQARYQQQLADWQTAGQAGPKPKTPKPLPPLTAEELAELPELPEGWGWVKLGALIDEPAYGTSKKCDYETAGVGVLRIPNVVSGKVDATDLKFAQFSPEETAAYRLETGDLLMIRSNGSVSIVGKCALVSPPDTAYLYAGYLIRLRPLQPLVQPAYLAQLLSSHELRKQIEYKAKSTSGVNNINSGEIQSLVLPICGLTEQKLILAELESKLSEADQLDQTLTTALQQADVLRQSILKKAFCGQLVKQDKNDEPAAALLERIRTERTTSPARGRQAKLVSKPLTNC